VFRALHMFAASDLRLFGLLLFFMMFLMVLVRVYLLRRRQDFIPISRLPLEDDESAQEPSP
jgi:cbb3-type cytochrome oxidase subunit 3